MPNAPRRGIATMKLDLDFFDDPAVQLLYEDNSAEDADGAAMLFLRMAMRAHRLDRPDVREEFERTRNQRRHRLLVMLADAGLIDDEGLRPSTFDKWRMPDSGWYDSARGRAGGLARAETANRDSGRFAAGQRDASVEPASASVETAYQHGSERSGSGAERNGAVDIASLPSLEELSVPEGDQRETVRREFYALAERAEVIADRSHVLRNPYGRQAERLLDLVDIHTLGVVLKTMDKVRDRAGRPVLLNELVNNVEGLLAVKVDTAAEAKSERADEAEKQQRTRVERTLVAMHFQHIEPHKLCPACREVV